MRIKVTVWNEYRHEKSDIKVADIYPDGIHGAIASYLGEDSEFEVSTATLEEPEHGLTKEILDNTDVLIWWGHCAHGEVSDEVARHVQERIICGMGFIALHSSHYSKPFKMLMGTSCSLKWREVGEKERIWVIEPGHPIAEGLNQYIELEHEEMYGERFDVPEPDTLVFIGWFQGGEVFRSGCCYNRGYGKVFYFQPGHETYPIYHNPEIIKVLKNAVKWARPVTRTNEISSPNTKPLEKLKGP